MTEVDKRRTAATARALLEAVAPQDIVRTLRTADSGQTRAVAPAIARVVGHRNWQQRLAQRLAGDVKYAVWRAVARGEREAAMRDAEEAVRKAPRNERARQEAALVRMRGDEDYAGDVERVRREMAERGDPRTMADEQADLMLEEVVRHATTILDSAYAAQEREQQQRGEMATTAMATEWFITVHGADRRAVEDASARVVEEVVSVVLVGVSRQATDHVHEIAFFGFPVSGTAVRKWTAERYMVRPRDVNAQPARNTGAAVRYVQRQSTEMLAVTYENVQIQADTLLDRQIPTGTRNQVVTWRQAVTRRWNGRIPAARGVRTHPLTGFEVYARPGGRYGEGGRYAEDEVSYTPRLDERTLAVHGRMSEAARRRMRAQLAPAALIYHPNAAVPASSYTVEDEALGVSTAFFFAREGTDAAAVEMERDTALTVHAGAAPRAMPVYAVREGAGLTDTPRPGEDTARAVEMLRRQAEVVAAMARGVRPPAHREERGHGAANRAGRTGTAGTAGERGERGESVVGLGTVRDMQQQAETDILRRAAREEIERRERELDVRVRTDGAPQYLRTDERQQSRDRSDRGDRGDRGGRESRVGRGTGRREVNMLYDERGTFEEDATETFGVAGIFYMIGSEATRYEGQPVVVVDADQALRHERHAREMAERGAVRHIYRGSREMREQAMQRLRQYSTPVSISNYPVV